MKQFDVGKFLEIEDEPEWYRVPDSLINNLHLSETELDFVKKMFVGYPVESSEVKSIPVDRMEEIIEEINDLLDWESDNYVVCKIGKIYQMLRIEGGVEACAFNQNLFEPYIK